MKPNSHLDVADVLAQNGSGSDGPSTLILGKEIARMEELHGHLVPFRQARRDHKAKNAYERQGKAPASQS